MHSQRHLKCFPRVPFSGVILVSLSITFGGRSVADSPVDYLTQVKPILSEKCYSCHGVLKQESGLRLETGKLMLGGGDSGAAIVPGDAENSLLIERITAEEYERMPPADEGASLRPDEIALLRRWIEQGAKAPHEEVPLKPDDHWAFQKINRPEIPDSEFENPIDALLEVQRSTRGLATADAAPRSLAIRRLYLDLIGLPPTPQQLDDDRPWDQIVEELLHSPHHGERWGRHWMDIWRYSDWYGLGAQLRYSQKHLWHWRDWIIHSLNTDKGYDRMVMEMLAGDELAPADPDAVAGTGFLARNYYLFNRTTWLDSTIEHTGKAFLGLTLNCAKCHDHKYDPITQVDYYRFRALFEPHQVRLDPVPGETDFEKDGLPRVFDNHLDAPTHLHRRGNPKDPDKETEIAPGVPAIMADFAPPIQPVALPVEAYVPAARPYVREDRLRLARERVRQAEAEVASARRRLEQQTAAAEASHDRPAAAQVESGTALIEEFDGPNDRRWQLIGEGWKYEDGLLKQSTVTREPYMARLLEPVPPDFELTCRFTTTGGSTYKSVTFRFDQSEDGKYANYVYTSAHEPGPKVQLAFTRNGTQAYPSDGRVAKKIEVGKAYTIRFAVRQTLVNVWLDDEFLLAYRLPDRRPDGFLSLSAFDATAAFDSLRLRPLPSEVELTESGNQPAVSATNPELAVEMAEARWAAATADLDALEAVIAADDARYRSESPAERIAELTHAAARSQAEAARRNAELKLLSQKDEKAVKAARAELKAAQERLAAIGTGDVDYETIRASRKALETPAHKETDYPPVYPANSTGRRLALARWITSRENPLTARVAVNHVWMRHFGKPLVDSVFDFGLRAERPEHVEVLDLLAYEFMESGWSFRALHRLIVTSQAYRLSSSTLNADPDTIASDPDNRYYWRMNSRRMESQIVRDSLLAIAGSLDRSIGGPSIDPSQPSVRRSIYFKHSRDQQDKFLSMFDDADLLQCYRRSESVVPQQSLALFNSKLSLDTAEKIAVRIRQSVGAEDWNPFVDAVFVALLGRQPNGQERQECQKFRNQLDGLLNGHSDPTGSKRIDARFVHAIMNHNDFVSIR